MEESVLKSSMWSKRFEADGDYDDECLLYEQAFREAGEVYKQMIAQVKQLGLPYEVSWGYISLRPGLEVWVTINNVEVDRAQLEKKIYTFLKTLERKELIHVANSWNGHKEVNYGIVTDDDLKSLIIDAII